MKSKYSDLLAQVTNIPRDYNDSVLLIDGLNTFLRSFTMINHVNPLGAHIGGLTGFLKSVGYAIKIVNPTRVIILFDGVGGSATRRNIYGPYKANRHINRMTNYSIFSNKEEEEDAVNDQMERLIQYLQCLPVNLLSIDGLEADDIIGYIATHFETQDDCNKITIMSADKDFLQLVTDKTQVYSPVKKKFYTPKHVLEEYDVTSKNFLTMKILLGDNGDNIPGVAGLGPKKLLKFFPEIKEAKDFTLREVIHKSLEDGEGMYKKVLENVAQLEINEKLMDLKNIPFSEENEAIMNSIIHSKPNIFNNHGFTILYNKDQLGESIPYVERWLTEVFFYLNSFK